MSKTIVSDDAKRKAAYWKDKNGKLAWADTVRDRKYVKRLPPSQRNKPHWFY
jgi:hypothetical protein